VNGNGTTATGSGFSAMLSSQAFWEGAFIAALVLLILAHKITVEGFVDV
jgi:hypothetical protein